MTISHSRSYLLALVLSVAYCVAVSVGTGSLHAEQRGPSRSKPPAASVDKEKASTEKAKETHGDGDRRTPFGRTKSPEKRTETASSPSSSPFVEVEEKGDKIVFKRRTPFGGQTWKKKRSELTPQEQEMLKVHQAKVSDKKTAETPPSASSGPTAAR